MGVSFQQIQKYEKGANRVSAVRLIQIAKALDTSPHELMGWNDAGALQGAHFDKAAYRLAKTWGALPDRWKAALTTFIDTLLAYEKLQ